MRTESAYISFYLKSGSILIFKSSIERLDCPDYIKFMVHQNGKSMLMIPYDKKCLTSFKTAKRSWKTGKSIIVHSKKFCEILAYRLGWDTDYSYRVPGKFDSELGAMVFDLSKALEI